MILLHTALQYQWQKVNQVLEAHQTPHTLPSWASYGVSIVKILEKIDHVTMAPRCMIKLNIE